MNKNISVNEMVDNFVEGLFTCILVNLFAITFGPQREKTSLRGCANNKGADQHAHPLSLLWAFVIRLVVNTISKLAECSIF